VKVAALFVLRDSVYKLLPGVDPWCRRRDCRRWPGDCPGVFHPPCRAWSCLKAFARPFPGERRLAVWSVLMVRRTGGVLEHPRGSSLWRVMGLPRPGEGPDRWGGFSLEVDQFHWGHKARKRTWLYIVGCGPGDLPAVPFREGAPAFVIGRPGRRPGAAYSGRWCVKWERAASPPEFAQWLVEVARRCKPDPAWRWRLRPERVRDLVLHEL